MTPEFFNRHWAIVIASVLAAAIMVFIVWRIYADSVPGRLRSHVRTLKRRNADAVRARKAVDKATAQLGALRAKSQSVAPRRVEEASGALEDAQMLLKIAADQVLIAGNLVRILIVEQYPPKHHEAMRKRYLGQAQDDGKPLAP